MQFALLFSTLLLIFFLGHVGGVCPHCSDTIEGGVHCGTDGATCPLFVGIQHNADLMRTGDLTQSFKTAHIMPRDLVPLFSKHILDQILGIHTAPRDGGTVDLTQASYATPKAVTQAYVNGHCSFTQALMELGDRLQGCATSVEIDKVNGAISMLKATGEDHINTDGDVLSFIWARIGSKFVTSREVVLRQATSTGKRVAQAMVRPDTERRFYQTIQYFIFMVSMLGLVTQLGALQFFRDVVFEPINRGLIDWQVAHEYMLIYFRAIYEDVTKKLNLANVYDSGRQDTYLTEARANAVICFRTGVGEARDDGDSSNNNDTTRGRYTGKFDANASKCCLSFNFKTKHQAKHLDANGVCKFNHKCMQWVSDKGPRGMCEGAHPKADCTYDPAKKLDKPLA